MTKNAPAKLLAVTLRLSKEDVALLHKTAGKLALPGEKLNLSRAARVLFNKARR